LYIALVTVLSGSVIGFFVGTRPSTERDDADAPQNEVEHSGDPRPLVPSYTSIGQEEWGPNRGWNSSIIQLSAPFPDSAEVPVESHEAWSLANDSHRRNRAFDGAPPTVPHSIDSIDATQCVACHYDGVVLDGQIARPMSHPYLTNCTQCHTTGLPYGGSAALTWTNPAPENNHEGLLWSQRGERAWIGAPPTLPHPVWMRQRCDSCHGATGRPGLRTSHPARQNCLQCHAPQSGIEQNPTLTQ
ncbi:MAG: nitrate reductase cytochrome c-type subunit, partial [Myxococcales bacterium]|nr:nitrate reductase cytochrome c-type subunit [Myxococcales bacterium]